jgi:hypothetical protein
MNPKKNAFALLMVLFLITITAILGVTYLASASLKRASSLNMVSLARAKYLAECGLQHAMYVCRNNPSQLVGTSAAHPTGPYNADATTDTYAFYGTPTPTVLGQWTLTGVGTCGTVSQTSSVTVNRTGGTDFTNNQGLMSAGSITVPSCVNITGNLIDSGSVTNKGYVNGVISYTGTFTASTGTTTKTPVKLSSASIPTMNWNNYKQYKVYSTTYNAQQLANSTLQPGVFPNNNCITAANPAGIAYYTIGIMYTNFTFQGTIVINGDLYIDGINISITPVTGFPALVVTGNIYVVDNSTFTANGLVYAAQGMTPYIINTAVSQTTINGAFVSGTRGYNSTLLGSHQIVYSAAKCKLYDPTGATSDAASASLQITSWND